MIGNLNGFWDSILALIRPVDYVFIGLTIMLVGCLIITKNKSPQKVRLFIIILATSIITGLVNGAIIVHTHENDTSYMNPFVSYDVTFESRTSFYVNDHSINHYLIYTIIDFIKSKETPYTITEEDSLAINKFINPSKAEHHPKTSLILCIVESLNSFVITKEFMPNLYNMINDDNAILFVPNIYSQEKQGNSGDGQMIIQSGLLPINKGVACVKFPFNKYPSISSLYKKSAGLFPGSLTTWNQYLMSPAYGIDSSYVTSIDDIVIAKKTIELSKDFDNIMMLTYAMHLPCTMFSEKTTLSLPDTIPTTLSNYIKCANYTDLSLKILIDSISQNERLKNTTIVITGDHCLPTPVDETFDNAYNYSRFIPLIIYSPEIKQKTIVTDTCYQMDIYPTILHLIGCEDYYWKGFGVNLLDSTARHNRPITPEEAYNLSDKLIRANYLKRF